MNFHPIGRRCQIIAQHATRVLFAALFILGASLPALLLSSTPATAAPTVNLTAPANNALYYAPASLTVRATASAPSPDIIVRVEFYANGNLIGTDLTSAYTFAWNGVAAGTYTLTAKAIDNNAGETISAARTITVSDSNTPPTINLNAPANNATFSNPASITVSAGGVTAPEVNGSITQVQFFANGNLIGTDTSAAYSISWANPTPGTYTLTAVATDQLGATTTSVPRTITVNGTNLPPTVNLTAPANNARYNIPATVTLNASATAPEANDTVAKVDFYANGNLIGTDTTASFSFVWSNPAPGTYALTARATDGQGAETTSNTRTITISATNTPPTSNLTAPANNSIYIAPPSLTLSANAGSPEVNGFIQRVEFYANGNLIDTDTTAPYSITWANPPPGTYTITAKAVDDLNAETISTPRTVTITAANAAPTATISAPANNAKFNAPANVTINANVAAPETNDTLARVEFYINGALAATVTAAPYSYTANNLAAGTYTLTVKAVDGFGLETTSPTRTIIISNTNIPPTVSLTAPANNSTVNLPGPITVSANANAVEVNGFITQVEFYANGNLIGTDTTAPFSIAWNPAPGTYSLTAKPTDNLTSQTTSAARTVTVVDPNQAPTITLTSPLNNASYTAPASITLTANATDSDGTITQVEFYNGTTLIGAVTSAPYTATWAAVPAGSYSLTAKATDNLGITTTSAPVTITVQATAPAGMYFIHPDHLNTPRLITDQAGTPVWRWDNEDPFGNNTPNENPNSVGNFTCNLRLPGQYFDRETNLHYNYFRDFDPSIGRYVQSDPIGINGGINTYSYVDGDPISGSDPLGLTNFYQKQQQAAAQRANPPASLQCGPAPSFDPSQSQAIESVCPECWLGGTAGLARGLARKSATPIPSKVVTNTAREKELAQQARELPKDVQRQLEREGYTRIDQVPGGVPYAEGRFPGWVRELGGTNQSAPGGRLPRIP